MNDILFGNNNKTVIKKLAQRSYHTNKVRNIAAILAIALTAFLFTAVTALALGMQSSIMLTLQMQKGSKADGDIRYMTEVQFKELVSSDFIERAGCRQVVGFATNALGHTIEINYADAVQQELTFSTPTHGTAPQAANEIATSELALKALGVEPEVGAKVPIEFELRGQSYRFDMEVSGWWEASDSSVSLMIVSNSFMEENTELFPNTFSTDREMTGTYLSDVVLKNKTHVKGQLEEFARSVGGEPSDIYAENFILCASNSVMTSMLQPSMVLAIVCFVFLFALCGYLLIYNIFDISVMQDVRQYGLLRTIGASARQVKKLVNMQAIKLTLIALPIGLIMGYLISWVLLPVVMSFLADYNSTVSTQIPLSPFIFIIAALFTVLTVYFSTRKPVKKASNISPLEAIRYIEQDNLRKKQSKRQKGAKLSQMAFSNFCRYKRRSVFIMISLLLCIVLFNSVIIVTQSIDKEKFISRMTKSDFTVYNSSCLNRTEPFRYHADALNASAVELINQQSGVTDEKYLYRNTLDDKDITVDYGFTELNVIGTDVKNGRTAFAYENGASVKVAPEENNRFYGNVFGASDGFLDSLTIHDGEKDKDILKQKLSTGDYVVLGLAMNMFTGEPNTGLPFVEDLQVGDNIVFYKNGEIYKTCTILATATLVSLEMETTAGPIGMVSIGGDAPYLYLSDNVFRQLYEQPTLLSYGFNVNNKKAEMSAFLNDLTEKNSTISYMSAELLEKQMQSTGNTILLVGGMIGIIFALAGLINLTNMMITNIITRKHEFATMQSIGMTHKQLRRMVMWEGVYYAIGAGILGCFLSTAFGMTVLQNVLNSPSMWFFTIQFTIIPALAVTVIYLIMAAAIPIAVLHFFNRGTVIERLRVSE